MLRPKKLAACLVYFCAVSGAGAVDAQHPFFTSICTDDQAAGFSWKSGGWHPAQFTSSSYIAERRSLDMDVECAEAIDHKKAAEDPSRLDFEPYSFSYGCYNVRLYSAEFNSIFDRVCWEAWQTINGVKVLTRVDCNDGFEIISFSPAGNYNYARISSQITDTPPLDRKTSLMVSVGKCKVIMQQ